MRPVSLGCAVLKALLWEWKRPCIRLPRNVRNTASSRITNDCEVSVLSHLDACCLDLISAPMQVASGFAAISLEEGGFLQADEEVADVTAARVEPSSGSKARDEEVPLLDSSSDVCTDYAMIWPTLSSLCIAHPISYFVLRKI